MAEVFKDQEKAPEWSGTSTFLTKMEAFPNRTDYLSPDRCVEITVIILQLALMFT